MSWFKKIFAQSQESEDAPKQDSAPVTQASPAKPDSITDILDLLLPRWGKVIELKDADSAEREYLAILKEYPIVLSASNNLAVLYNERQRYSDSLELLKTAPIDDPKVMRSNNYVTLGVTYYALGKNDEAVKIFEKASANSAYANLCFLQARLENYDAAVVAGEKAVEESPDDLLANANLIAAYQLAGQQSNAIAHLEKISKSINVQSLNPGVRQNRSIHIELYDPASGMRVMADATTKDTIIET